MKAHIPAHAIAEVPFSFGVRAEGESKLTGKVMIKYLEQLGELYWYRFSTLVVLFIVLFFFMFIMLARSIFGTPSPAVQDRY